MSAHKEMCRNRMPLGYFLPIFFTKICNYIEITNFDLKSNSIKKRFPVDGFQALTFVLPKIFSILVE
jgi:hypothetical protein